MIRFWKKCIISVAVLVAVGMVAKADEYGIIISKVDGTKNYVRFSEMPKISFSKNDEIVFSTNVSSIALRLDEMESYTFGDVPVSGPASVTEPKTGFSIDFLLNDNEIMLKNIETGAKIKVYTVGGIEMITKSCNDMEAVVINISDLEHGVYILTVNDTHIFKFSKR